jgi:hypothetical protein
VFARIQILTLALLFCAFLPLSPGFNWAPHADATAYANELLSAEVTKLANGVEVIPMTTFLQGTEAGSPFIITRKCTRDLWDIVMNLTRTLRKHVLVTGSSGVGKSRSMAYLLRNLLLNGKTVVYESAEENIFFLFKPTGDKEGGGYEVMSVSLQDTSAEKIVELKDPDNFYLVDPSKTSGEPVFVPAHTILASSPNPKHYKGFVRRDGTTTLYMPLWKIEELETVRHILDSSVTVTKDDLLEMFQDLGGRPRSIFNKEIRGRDLNKIPSSVTSMDPDLVTRIVVEGYFGDLDESESRKLNIPSSNICGYDSTHPFDLKSRKIVFVSELVEKELANAHARYLLDVYDKLSSHWKGLVFESIALGMIAGGKDLKCTHWEYKGKDKNYKVTSDITKRFTPMILRTKHSLMGHLKEDGVLNKSFKTNEALIDGSSAEGTFQMTIGEDHPNSRGGTKLATDGWGATAENKMPLYYVVPSSRYPLWSKKKKPPPFQGPTPQGWEGDDAMYAKIDFFVLEIPMTPDVMAQFNGLKIN